MPFLPFESLLRTLRAQGFSLGIDTYMQVQQLLNAWEETAEPLHELRIQLGALLARDLKEQQQFYRIFDAFVDAHSYTPPVQKPDPSPGKNLFFWLLACAFFLALLGIGYTLFRSHTGVALTVEYLQERHTQRVWIHPRAEVKAWPPFIRDSLLELTEEVGGRRYTEKSLFVENFSRSARYSLKATAKSRYGKDSAQVELWVRNPLSVRLAIADTLRKRVWTHLAFETPGWDHPANSSLLREKVKQADSLFEARYIPEDRVVIHWNMQGDSLVGKREDLGAWSWEGAGRATRDTLSFEYASYGPQRIRYQATRIWKDRASGKETYRFNAGIQPLPVLLEPPNPVDVSPVSLRGIDLEPLKEDIADLVKQPRPDFWDLWPIWLSLLVLLLYGLYELWRYRTRKLVLDTTSHGPPSQKRLRIPRPQVELVQTLAFDQAVLGLRSRKLGEGLEVDIPQSLRKTIDQAGIPELIWRRLPQSAQYVLLIEEHSSEDQQAQYFAEWAEALRNRDISVETWFYDSDPSLCWKKRHEPDTETELERILAEYGNYRLIVIGSGEGLLSGRKTGAWSRGGELLQGFETRAFLSTVPTEEWGYRESLIRGQFALAPASFQGLGSLIPQWEEEHMWGRKAWHFLASDIAPPSLRGADKISELKAYLGPRGFKWLCCCAVYPELYWELTLYFGQLVGLLGTEGENLPEEAERVLMRMLRLPPFRSGRMSRELRISLVNALEDESLLYEVRAYVIDILEASFNKAPAGSLARLQQVATLAIYRYLNSAQTPEDLEALKQGLSPIPGHRLKKDVVSLQSVQRIRDNAQLLQLPRSFYKDHIPIRGTRWIARLGLVLLPLMLMWGSYSLLSDNFLAPPPYKEPYTLEKVQLENASDSARWALYQGQKEYEQGGFEAAEDHFLRASRLDPSNEIATVNYAKTQFGKGIQAYEDFQFNLAAQIFTDCCLYPNFEKAEIRADSLLVYDPASIPVSRPNRRQISLPNLLSPANYASGASYLYGARDSLGLTKLKEAGRAFYEDANSLYNRAPQKEKVFRKLVEVSQRLGSERLLNLADTLAAWMGRDIPQPDQLTPLLAEADSLMDVGEIAAQAENFPEALTAYKLALNAYEEVLQLDAANIRGMEGQRAAVRALQFLEARQAVSETATRLQQQVDSLLSLARQLPLPDSCARARQLYRAVLVLQPENAKALEGLQACEIPSELILPDTTKKEGEGDSTSINPPDSPQVSMDSTGWTIPGFEQSRVAEVSEAQRAFLQNYLSTNMIPVEAGRTHLPTLNYFISEGLVSCGHFAFSGHTGLRCSTIEQ